MKTRKLVFATLFLSYLAGCTTTGDVSVPTQCDLADGLRVESLTINLDEVTILPRANAQGRGRTIPVSVRLNRAPDTNETVCFVVRDVQVPFSPPIAVGFAVVPVGRETGGNGNGFILFCDGTDVSARATVGELNHLDRSTNENNTKIFIQHLEDADSFETFLWTENVTGLSGIKSNRPRVRCPNLSVVG